MTPEEALALYHTGPELVVTLPCELSKRVSELENEVQRLKDQRAKNSRNSSKPPSSDDFKKPSPKSLRPRGRRKPGGQKGHPGSTLTMVANPDHTILYPIEHCERCGCPLTEEAPSAVEKRQIFDIPPIQMEITEHQAEIKPCPQCGYLNKAAFPEQVKAPVQYGPRLKAIAVYLRHYQLLPYHRTCELVRDLFSTELSEGTLTDITETCSASLQQPRDEIRKRLAQSPVVHFDETGSSVEGTRHWLQSASTTQLTYYEIHPKRGTQAMDQIGILPHFTERAIHDFWKPYLTYECDHGLCNAHHLRELTFLYEQHHQGWAKEMIERLLDIKKAVDETRGSLDTLFKEQIQEFEKRYQNILDKGYQKNPLPERDPRTKRRGRRKKSKARNLLERLDTHRTPVLAFMYEFSVPFDNNLAERDLRMAKVQQKISGTFRSQNGATSFCRIRSYISTARKNALNALEALRNAFSGKPYIPVHDTS